MWLCQYNGMDAHPGFLLCKWKKSYMRFVTVYVVHSYSCVDIATAWKKIFFILSDRSDFYMINNHPIASHALSGRMLTSLSVDEMLLTMYMNCSTNFSDLPRTVEMAAFCLKLIYSVLFCIYIEANASHSLL